VIVPPTISLAWLSGSRVRGPSPVAIPQRRSVSVTTRQHPDQKPP
jgi:hypothetical protein